MSPPHSRLRRLRPGWAVVGVLSIALAGLLATAAAISQSEPQNRFERFNRGLGLLDQLKFEEAAAIFASLVASEPALVAAHVNHGVALYYARQPEGARRSLEAALQLQPDQLNAHYMLGLIAQDAGLSEQARSHFELVRLHDPDDASTHYYLGRIEMEMRRYDGAVEHFREVVAIEPYNASAQYNLATALLRTGDTNRAQAAMREFQRLQGLFGSRTVGLGYLEQGSYAAPVDSISPAPEAAPTTDDAFEVRFVDIAADSGIDFRHSGTAPDDWVVDSRLDLERSIVGALGSAPAFGDFDNDGDQDLFLADAGSAGSRGRLYRNSGNGRFEDVTRRYGLDAGGPTMHALWGDIDGDGHLDLYLINYGANRLLRNTGEGRFEEIAERVGVADQGWGLGGSLVDFDHDGDLDIYVANFVDPEGAGRFPEDFQGSPNALYRNNGNGTFRDVSLQSGLADDGQSTAVVTADFDASRDIDFYVVNLDGPNSLYENQRDGTFTRTAERQAEGPPATTGAAVGQLADRALDLVLAGPTPTILRNRGAARFRRSTTLNRTAHGARLLDVDNDGDLDLLTLDGLRLGTSSPEGVDGLRLYENRRGAFVDVTRIAGLDRFQGLAVRGISAADIDQDGDLDLAVSVNGGSPLLLRNEGGNRGHWLQVKLEAVNSSPNGIGARVEVLAGRQRSLRQLSIGSGFLSSDPPVAHFGLGPRDRVDAIRLLWPNGVLQTELDDPGVDQRRTLRELNRKGTSCPLLYVWDGRSYHFQTDLLGGSAFGYQLAPGVFNVPDTDEYVKLDRSRVSVEDGRVSMTLNNQLEEVIFFDRLQLLVVDHPAGYDVFADEKLLPGPPYAPFRLITAARPQPPRSAVDGSGRDQLPALKRIDRRYADIVRPLPFKGYAFDQELILDLGDTGDGAIWLLMHAWIDYADSTSNVAAAQAGFTLKPPQLDVLDQRGQWVTAIERLGFPAGLPKTMTADLTGVFLTGSRKIRIRTNMRIHWDQILVSAGPPRTDYRVHRIETESARLGVHGFPEIVFPDGKEPRRYRHDRSRPTSSWKVHPGAYTRLGDVRPLLTAVDDRFVVTRSGDQIEARFDVSRLPDLEAGWVRDFFVYVDGFGKDMDPNSAAPNAVGPLPFHGMSRFPDPDGDPGPFGPDYLRYLREWNTRLVEEPLPPLSDLDRWQRNRR